MTPVSWNPLSRLSAEQGAGAFTSLIEIGANVTSYSDSKVTPLTSYTYRIRAANSAGDSPYSNEASATTPYYVLTVEAYVANQGSSNISVIDTSTNIIRSPPIGVGSGPKDIAFTPDGTKAYVSNGGSDSVTVIDATTRTVVTSITVGSQPHGIAIAPDGTKAYVATYGSDKVAVIDTNNDTVIRTITVGTNPHSVAITPDGAKVYVTNNGSDSVTVIDTATDAVIGLPITVGSHPAGVAVTPDGSKAYVAIYGSGSPSVVAVINTVTDTVTNTVSVDIRPHGVAVSPDGSHVYITNLTSNSISVINTATDTVNTTILNHMAFVSPVRIAFTPSGAHAYVTNQSPDNDPPNDIWVTVIDTTTGSTEVVAVGRHPFGLALRTFVPPEATVHPDVGGIVADKEGSGAAFSVPAGILPGSTDVFIDVSPNASIVAPVGFTANGTLLVDIRLAPNPGILPAPGATITLPLKSPMLPGTKLSLFKFIPETASLLDLAIEGIVDLGGITATFSGVRTFSVFAAFQANQPPTANAGGPYTVDEGGSVPLIGSGSDPDAGDTLTFAWDLDGDGTFETPGQNITFSAVNINGPATRTVKLRVTDSHGASVISSATVNILNVAPTITSVTNTGPVNEGSPVAVTIGASDPGAGDTLTYYFDFNNDGNFEVIQSTPSATFTYADNGSYVVRVQVRDQDGGVSDVASTTVTVNNVPPTVTALTATPNPVNEGSPVSFSGAFTDPGADTHTILWNFGDGAMATGTLTPTHTYADNGTYTVTLTVTDDDGGIGSSSIQVTVNNVPPSVTSLTAVPNPANEGQAVAFTGAFTDPGTADTHTILWSFGDGSTATGTLLETAQRAW
jgi:YVTN family beta-propeller protein